jgi:hypothetical protein
VPSLVTRRHLQVALGLLWLFDGCLQFQPSMGTPSFYGMMLRMGPAAPPAWLWDLGSRIEPLLTTHAALANFSFASLEVLLGLGMFFRRTVSFALAASLPWAIAVWLLGEAAGGLFVEGANAMTGAPGAVLIYVPLALLLWPRGRDDLPSIGTAGLLGRRFPDLVWVAVWVGTAALEAESINRMPLYASGAISNAGNGGPGWLTAANHAVGGLIGIHGSLFALCAALSQAAIGLGVLAKGTRSASLAAGVLVALFYGVVGQGLGGIFSNGLFGLFASGATDPGTGPPMVLLALCLWPRTRYHFARPDSPRTEERLRERIEPWWRASARSGSRSEFYAGDVR